jgi:hypothetical protein
MTVIAKVITSFNTTRKTVYLFFTVAAIPILANMRLIINHTLDKRSSYRSSNNKILINIIGLRQDERFRAVRR